MELMLTEVSSVPTPSQTSLSTRIRSFIMRIFSVIINILATLMFFKNKKRGVKKAQQNQGENIEYAEPVGGTKLKAITESEINTEQDIPCEEVLVIERIMRNRFQLETDLNFEPQVARMQRMITRDGQMMDYVDDINAAHVEKDLIEIYSRQEGGLKKELVIYGNDADSNPELPIVLVIDENIRKNSLVQGMMKSSDGISVHHVSDIQDAEEEDLNEDFTDSKWDMFCRCIALPAAWLDCI